MTTRLMEVTIPCRRYQVTRRFYTDTLGLRIGREGRHHCFLDTGGSHRLALVDAAQVAMGSQPTGRGAFVNLATDDLAQVRRRLVLAGVRIDQEAADQYGRNLTVHDPEGTVVNVFQDGTF